MKKLRVFVGMSGGVDSSVSAALLKKAGFEVIGVFIRVWEPTGFVCNWREERRWARRVAAHLDIPLITLDLSREYKKRVVDYFIAEYKSGRTPNPDVMCNKHIKFGVFYDWAVEKGADFIATGHYAQINKSPDGSYLFTEAKDQNKDQTYFLWNLHTEQLKKIIFPIGKYTKPEVRVLAKKFNLPSADKKDSQGLCFVGKIDFKDFLKREIKEKVGNVLDEQGKIIGQHKGATFFTIGERHGFDIFEKTPTEKPYYIISKNIKENTLSVSPQLKSSPANKLEVAIEKTNWINYQPEINKKYRARIRYRQDLQDCLLVSLDKDTATFSFAEPQIIASGQSLVLYDKENCLGGGVIQ